MTVDTAALLDEAIGRLTAGDAAAAEALCRRVLAEAPANFFAYHLLTVTARRTGRLDEAKRNARKAWTLEPAAAETFHNLGACHQDCNELAAALRCFRRALHIKPTHALSYHDVAAIEAKLGRWDAAMLATRQAVQFTPDQAKTLFRLASLSWTSGDADAALRWSRRALRLAPDDGEIACYLADLCCVGDRPDEARRFLHHGRLHGADPQRLARVETFLAEPEPETVGSIVIPAYRAEGFILRALDSVERSIKYFRHRRGRTDAAFRIIVVDDGSPDDTLGRVRAWGDGNPHVEVLALRSNVNRGQGYCRNLGAQAAAGPLVWFLDADDLFLPPHLYRCAETMAAEPDTALVKTGFVLDVEIHPDWYGRVRYTCPSNICVRNACHRLIGGFPEERAYRVGGEDGAYMEAIDHLFFVRILDDRTVWHTHHPGNAFDRQLERFVRPFETVAPDALPTPDDPRGLLRDRMLWRLERGRRQPWDGPRFKPLP